MFGTIRKHQTWLWAIIITLTVISFVIYFSPYTRTSNERRRAGAYGLINGEAVTPEQIMEAQNEVRLRYFFMSGGRWPDQQAERAGFDMEREVYQWLLLASEEEQLGIRPGTEAVTQLARQMFDRAGIPSASVFLKQVLEPNRLTLEDFERYLRRSLALQELMASVGVSSKLIPPQEAKELYVRENQELASEAVFFQATNFLASVAAPAPEALSQFYSNRLAQYRIPEKVQVSYVKFGVSNYLAQAKAELTNMTEIVEANMQQLGTNYTRFGKTPEEAKAKIGEEVLLTKARSHAANEAREFLRPLADAKEQPKVEDFEKLAKDKGLAVKVTAPFDREDGPKDLEVGNDFTTRAFSRTPQDPLAGPLAGQDGVYVIAFKNRIPSEVPPLDRIRDRVLADYKLMQSIMAARNACMDFYRSVTNGLAQGKQFPALCTEAKVKPVELPPFSLSTRGLPDVELAPEQLRQVAITTPPGKATIVGMNDGGSVVYVKSKLPIDEAKLRAELPAFTRYEAQRRQDEAFNAWFNKVAQKGLRDTPLNRPQQRPPAMGAGAAKAAKS